MKKHNVTVLLASLCLAGAILPSAGCLGDEAPEANLADLDKGLPKIQIFAGADGEYYFNVRANNGEIVLRSEGYQTEAGARNGVASAKVNGIDLTRYVLLQATSGEWYFNLRAGNNKIIGTSEMYSSKSNARRGLKTAAAILGYVDSAELLTPASPRFETFRGLDSKWYVQLIDASGETVLRSQAYGTKATASAAIDKLYAVGVAEDAYQVRNAQNSQRYFVVAEGEAVLGYGKTYSSATEAKAGRDATRALLRRLTPEDKVICTLERLPGIPTQDELDDAVVTAASALPSSQDVILLASEEWGEGGYVDAYLGSYGFSVEAFDGELQVFFYESEYVSDEVASLTCGDVPASYESRDLFCQEPIIVNANLGVPDDADDALDVHALNFWCRYE